MPTREQSVNTFIAFPCYQPSPEQWHALEKFIDLLQRTVKLNATFCVVNDGSPRFTMPTESLRSKITLEHLPKNKGKGAALRRAVELMPNDCEVFAFLDFDLPYPIEDLTGICASVANGVDACIGIRPESGSSDRLSRKISHKLFRLFVRAIVVGSVSDTQCGIKAFHAPSLRLIAQKSKIDGFLFDMEWLYIALHHNLCVRQWPVTVGADHASGRLSSYKPGKLANELFTLIANVLKRNYDHPELESLTSARRRQLVSYFLER